MKSEPKKVRYRIDVPINKKMTSEQIQMYSESGWDYVTSYRFFHVFSSPDEIEAPELHTDPAEQSYTLKELDKNLAMNAGIVIVGLILMIGMLSFIWFLDGTPTLVMVKGTAIQLTILVIIIGYLAYNSLRASISIRALRRSLIEGKPIVHHAPWKNHYRLHATITFLFTVVAAFSVIIPLVQLIKMDTKTLPESNFDLPIVRLSDVEENPAMVRGEPSYMSDNVDWGNRYSYNWSPLAPVQYETDEEGVVPGKVWKDESGEYSPTIHTQVYQLSVPVLTDQLISDLIKRYRYENSRENFVEAEHSNLDSLIVHVDEEMKEVFVAKGKAVMYVRYHGYADVNSVIETTVKNITSISD